MAAAKSLSRRRLLMNQVDPGERNSGKGVEMPIGTRPNTMAQEIQHQIAIQIAKNQGAVPELSQEQIENELQDLEEDDEPDPNWATVYTVQQMAEHPYDIREHIAPEDIPDEVLSGNTQIPDPGPDRTGPDPDQVEESSI